LDAIDQSFQDFKDKEKEITLKDLIKEHEKKTNTLKKEARQNTRVNQGNTDQAIAMTEKTFPFPNSSSRELFYGT